MCQITYACSTYRTHTRTPCARAMSYTNKNTLFNNELKTEMTTIIPLANRARSHIALTRPSWVSLASGEREAQPLLPTIRHDFAKQLGQYCFIKLLNKDNAYTTLNKSKNKIYTQSFFTFKLNLKFQMIDSYSQICEIDNCETCGIINVN